MPEFEGEGRSVLCNLFRSMNSSQCLSLPIINSLSSTISKTGALEMAFGFKCLFEQHKCCFLLQV